MAEFDSVQFVPVWESPINAAGRPRPLNFDDPIEGLLIDFKQEVANDKVPSMTTQRTQVEHFQTYGTGAESRLIAGNIGLIAVGAFPFAGPETQSADLLHDAKTGFIDAASTYRPWKLEDGSRLDFSDYALIRMSARLAIDSPVELNPIDLMKDRPMDQVFRFLQNVGNNKRSGRKPDSMESRLVRLSGSIGVESVADLDITVLTRGLTPTEKKLVEAYYFSDNPRTVKEIAEEMDLATTTATSLKSLAIKHIRNRLQQDAEAA